MSNQMVLSASDVAALGVFRDTFNDLGAFLGDVDQLGLANIDASTAHMHGPQVLANLGNILQHPHLHKHHGHQNFGAIQRLLHSLYSALASNRRLHEEKALWHTRSNVVSSVQWVGVPANSLSSVCTQRAPYSGVNYMILDCMMDTAVTPLGWWTQVTFAGINFATPSTNATYSTAAGTAGTPSQQGMGFAPFLQDKTAPEGCRGWSPWTGWILSSDAQIFWQWFNADQSFARSLCLDVLERSSPCDTDFHRYAGKEHYAHHEDEGYHYLLNAMHAATIGLRGAPKDMFNDGHYLQQLTQGQQHRIMNGGVPMPNGHSGPAGRLLY